MLKGLELLLYEESLRLLGVSSVEKGLMGDLVFMYKYLAKDNKDDIARLFFRSAQ